MGVNGRDFGDFYPGGGVAQPGYGSVQVAVDGEARARLDALASAAGAITDLDPDGPESEADVKERQNAILHIVADA